MKKKVALTGIRTWHLSVTIVCSRVRIPTEETFFFYVRKIANFSYCVVYPLYTTRYPKVTTSFTLFFFSVLMLFWLGFGFDMVKADF